MVKAKEDLLLSNTDKELLIDVLLSQKYAKEIVSCEISDIERGLKAAEEDRIKILNQLFDRLDAAGI